MVNSTRYKRTIIVATLIVFYSGLSNADDNGFFPLYPRLNVTGGMGNNNFGAADVMVPLFGTTDAIAYTDISGQTGKGKSNFLSLGMGARDAINDDVMWGGYVFVDRSKSNDADSDAHWTVFNPGVEFMTNHWDGRINGYIPTGNKENSQGPFFGDQVDEPGAITFSGHNQYSGLFNQVEEIGPGGDVDAGYTFTSLRHFRVHGGGYFFKLSDTGNINGGEAGAEMPINNYAALQVDDSYDNIQKNTAIVSVRLTLGGIDKFSAVPTVQERMLDPIYRHLGALGTNTGIPSNNEIIETNHTPQFERSNIWFFNANGGETFNAANGDNNCTFEQPCIGTSFNQGNINTINGINSNVNFYFTPGTYTFSTPNNLNLNLGQSLYGRNSTYTLPASTATGFPTFVGEIDPEGNNTLDSFALINNTGSQSIGVHISNASNILINNLQIGNINNIQQSYANSIQLDNANNITVQNSTIQSLTNASSASILSVNGNSSLTFNHNTSTIMNSSLSSSTFGVDHSGTGSVYLNNNIFNITGASVNITPAVVGISNTGTIFATNNTFNINTTGNLTPLGGIPLAFGVINTGALILTKNTFMINSPNLGINGIINNGAGTIHLDNNNFSLISNAFVVGIDNSTGSAGAITGSNNAFMLTGSGTNTCGLNIASFYPGNGNTFTGC